MDPIQDLTVHLSIFGKVQGVSYRANLKHLADELSIRGWARNLSDGSVEALIQGKEGAVRKAIDWCRRGPLNARVDYVETKVVDSVQLPGNFIVLQ